MSMSKKVLTTESHVRKHVFFLNHKDLENLIAEATCEQIGRGNHPKPKLGRPGVSFKVQFEDETQGSPAYRVGTKAKVEIVEDLLPQPAECQQEGE